MLGRLLLVGGVAWLAALVLLAALIQWSARQPLPLTPNQHSSSALIRSLNRVSGSSPVWPEWVVTQATSAQHVVVMDVEARHPEQAQAIAAEIVAPIRTRYDEVLIYVKGAAPGANSDVRRIQWTQRHGYVETRFRDAE